VAGRRRSWFYCRSTTSICSDEDDPETRAMGETDHGQGL
jgi:hypothetical protein